jgi:hypothetical protein
MVQRPVTRHHLDRAGLKADKGPDGAVALIQRFGSAANLNINLLTWCWTPYTRATPVVYRPLSRRMRPATMSCARYCRRSSLV